MAWLRTRSTHLLAILALLTTATMSAAQPAGPVTMHLHAPLDLATLDPQLASDPNAADALENLFLGLTDLHPVTGEIRPELATDWSFDLASTTWTFTLREDVSWVRYDAGADAVVPVRPLVAGDFVAAVQRTCDPRTSAVHANLFAGVIAGCEAIYSAEPATITPERLAQIGVSAPDDRTLRIQLEQPTGSFLALTTLSTLRAIPAEIAAAHGSAWTRPEYLVSSGAYVLTAWEPDIQRVFRRNPLLPPDLAGPGNVERVTVSVVENATTAYALYLDNQLDAAPVPLIEYQKVLADPVLARELYQISTQTVSTIGFDTTRPPFDSVYVRRAFSAALDRTALVENILSGLGLPMMHLIPPGTFGASPLNRTGIDNGPSAGFDPDFARAELARAGYADCADFPTVNLLVYQDYGFVGEFLQAEVARSLDCTPEAIRIELQELPAMLARLAPSAPADQRPHLWTLSWTLEYPDAHNWLFDSGLHCQTAYMGRCTPWDALVTQALLTPDPVARAALYQQAEEQMFGYAGEHRIITTYLGLKAMQVKPWLIYPVTSDGLHGGAHWDWATIDAAAQRETRRD